VEAMREQGIGVDTFSVRTPSESETVSELDRPEAERTFYILRQSLLSFAGAHVAAFFTRPADYLRTFGLSLSHRAPGMRGLLLGVAHFAESILLARELKRRGLTHLHNHFTNSAATVGLLATRFLRIGWSFTMHGISETDYPAGLMLGRKIEAANLVACVSWFGRAQGMRLVAPAHWDKMHVIRCGLPFDRLPARESCPGDVRTIICVGRLSPEKGQAGLLRVFAALLRDHPSLRLRLVGDGPDRSNLESLACELGIDGALTFVGRLSEEETLNEIARSDLLVLPSFMEGLPIVLMEAMAIGVPVVASGVAGIPELVEDGVTGLLFEPSNWSDFRAQIERLMSDEELRTKVTKAGREKVSAEFNTRRSAAELSRLFRETNRPAELTGH